MRRVPAIAAMLLFVSMLTLAQSKLSLVNGGKAFGQDTEASTLVGIDTLAVAVEDVGGDNTLHLDKNTIQTGVEQKLRLAGLRVVPNSEAYVHIAVLVVGTSAVYTVELRQGVRLWRNGDRAFASTWSRTEVTMNTSAEFVQGRIQELVGSWLNDWLSVNLKK